MKSQVMLVCIHGTERDKDPGFSDDEALSLEKMLEPCSYINQQREYGQGCYKVRLDNSIGSSFRAEIRRTLSRIGP